MTNDFHHGQALTTVSGLMPGKQGRRARRKYTVFLIEDDVADRGMVLQTLKRSPLFHKLRWFRSGERMLRYFAYGDNRRALFDCAPALILLDISVPGADGLSILRQFKLNPLTSYVPIVVLTGNSSHDKKAEAFRLGANAYIQKPLDLERLHDVMLTGWSWPPLWSPPVLS